MGNEQGMMLPEITPIDPEYSSELVSSLATYQFPKKEKSKSPRNNALGCLIVKADSGNDLKREVVLQEAEMITNVDYDTLSTYRFPHFQEQDAY
jgi:hypothetical protein